MEPDDEQESCGIDFEADATPDENLLYVVLSPEGDPARIEEYHRLATAGGA
ncbi:MAG TPA: hypothetical protein VM938_09270 [Acidimicrobiales bacterium]|nr:hypothetical protein [Acidimicrobiales bacterium]